MNHLWDFSYPIPNCFYKTYSIDVTGDVKVTEFPCSVLKIGVGEKQDKAIVISSDDGYFKIVDIEKISCLDHLKKEN